MEIINNTVNDRLSALRSLMEIRGFDAVIVPTGDYHMSEYTGEYFKCREYISGFTGSAGTAVIFGSGYDRSLSGLWTDSRYFLQAEKQLEGSGISLFRIGSPEVPSITSHLTSILPEGSHVACDGRVISFDTFAEWYDTLMQAGIELDEQTDLIGEIWHDRPQLQCSSAFEYDVRFSGRSRAEKLDWLMQKVADHGADAHLLTNLDDIAWLLNIRGSDIHCNPVIFSYFLIDNGRCRLFANKDSFSEDLAAALEKDGVSICPYDAVDEALQNLESGGLLLSATDTNSYLYGLVPQDVYMIEAENPTSFAKSVKNSVEIENARIAHLKDAVALTKFIFWLKNSISADHSGSAESVTELTAADKLYALRSNQDNFIGNSFDPIIAYAEHAAIVHYSATDESSVPLQPKSLLLCDTGAHYLEGTTDVTRTIALGPLTCDELKMSTAVLRGHIALASAVFPYGLNGGNLDYLAHAPLWKLGRDYGHGTGHGVGHFLNVHEGPNYIHWSRNGNTGTTPPFESGMITSCEPGYYEEGKFGIRHESLLLCKPFDPAQNDTFADFSYVESSRLLCFEELTLVPFDLDAIDISALDEHERSFLNSYHQKIYEKICAYLTDEERKWLRKATRKI